MMRNHVDILAVAVLLFGFAVFSTVRNVAMVRVQPALDRIQVSNGVIRSVTELPRNLTLIYCRNR